MIICYFFLKDENIKTLCSLCQYLRHLKVKQHLEDCSHFVDKLRKSLGSCMAHPKQQTRDLNLHFLTFDSEDFAKRLNLDGPSGPPTWFSFCRTAEVLPAGFPVVLRDDGLLLLTCCHFALTHWSLSMSYWWFKSPWRLGYSFSYEEQLINECVFHYCFVTVVSIYCKLIKCCTLVFMDQHIKSINYRIWLLLILIVDRGENPLERVRQVTKITEWAEDGNEIWRSEVRIWLYQRVLPYNFSHFLFWTPCQEGGRSQPSAGLVPGSVPNRGTHIVPRPSGVAVWVPCVSCLHLHLLKCSSSSLILAHPST